MKLESLACAACLAAAMTAGCGNGRPVPSARPQSVSLGWHENCGTRANPIPVTTRRLVVSPRRWRVELAFRNGTTVTLSVVRPHSVGGTYFGLEPFETTSRREILERAKASAAKPRTIADQFAPATPRILAPGDRWAGSFSGPGSLPAKTPLRVVLGRFVVAGDVPTGFFESFLCISDHVVRLK